VKSWRLLQSIRCRLGRYRSPNGRNVEQRPSSEIRQHLRARPRRLSLATSRWIPASAFPPPAVEVASRRPGGGSTPVEVRRHLIEAVTEEESDGGS
jgi:hypothetical protein